jgi:hypothetical protein
MGLFNPLPGSYQPGGWEGNKPITRDGRGVWVGQDVFSNHHGIGYLGGEKVSVDGSGNGWIGNDRISVDSSGRSWRGNTPIYRP